MAGCANGAELVKKLAATGTGEGKLAGPRKMLADVHRTENRVATATEVLAVLETGQYEVAGGKVFVQPAPEGTLEKARAIIRTGEWTGPVATREVPIEELLLAGGDPARAAAAPESVPESSPAPAAEAGDGEKKAPAKVTPKTK